LAGTLGLHQVVTPFVLAEIEQSRRHHRDPGKISGRFPDHFGSLEIVLFW
jgi:hypothetical protein